MKKIILSLCTAALLIWMAPAVNGQACTFTSSFGSGTINTSGAIVTLSTCSFAGEYSTVSGAVAGQSLRFTSSAAGDMVTIHTGSSSGPIIGSGTMPFTLANTFTGTIYAHWSQPGCVTQSSCRTTTVQCLSCAPPPPGPCNNTTSFGSATISTAGSLVTISTCSNAGEYSTISGAVSGQTLVFTSSASGDQITIRSGSSGGPVVASGPSPLTVANTFTGTLYAHWNTSGCGSQSSCRTTTVQCTSCTAPPGPCTNTSSFGSAAIDAGGATVTISTCSFAGEYSTVSGAVAGQTLVFSSSGSGDVVTVHSGSPSGPVLAFGPSPLTFANTFTGTVYAHWNTPGCGSNTSCRTTTVRCSSCTAPPPTPPANDICDNAINLACGGTVTGNTTNATDDLGLSACGSTLSNTRGVWYKITPSSNSSVTLSACGSGFDTYLRVFEGTCGGPQTCIGFNDDFCGLQSQLSVNLTGGTTYYILLSGFSTGSFGAFTLSATCTVITNCFDFSFTAPFTNTSTTCGAGDNSSLDSPGGGGEDHIYKVTIPTTGCYTVSLCGSATVWDSYLYVSTDCPGPGGVTGGGTVLGQADDNCPGVGFRHGSVDNLNLTAGQIIYVTVQPFSSGVCDNYTLSVQPGTPPVIPTIFLNTTAACGVQVGCGSTGNIFSVTPQTGVTFNWTVTGGTIVGPSTGTSINVTWGTGTGTVSVNGTSGCGTGPTLSGTLTCTAPPANDLCANAESIAAGDVKCGSTCLSTPDPGLPTACGDFTSVGTRGGNWYHFTGDGRTYDAFTCNGGTNYDTKLHVFSGSCGGFTCVTNNDDVGGCASGIFRSAVNFPTTCGTEYYILVNGFSTAVGSYCLTLNATCSAITATGTSTDVQCFGACDGTISASASGTCGIVYNLSGASTASNTTGNFTGLCPGNYTVTASSANGACVSNALSFTITEPTALAGSIDLPATSTCGNYNISCNGGCIDITASASGGTPGYTYAWDGGAASADPALACAHAGAHTLVITDAHNCSLTLTVTLTQPDPIVVTLSSPADQCGYEISSCCVVNGSGSGSGSHAHGSASHARTGATTTDGHDVNSVSGGRSHGSGSGSGNLPDPCGCGHDGVIHSSVTGGCGNYSYAWSTAATTDSLGCLAPGLYMVTVTDENGCTGTASIVLDQAGPLTVAITSTNSDYHANNGTATANVTGGCGPFNYYWKKGSAGSSAGSLATGTHGSHDLPNTATISGLKKGKYAVWVQDSYGCWASAEVQILENPRPGHKSDGGAGNSIDTQNMTINAFPNPTKGVLDVQVNCQECGNVTYDLKMTDALGQVVLVKKIELNDGFGALRIDVSDISSGVYMINVNDLVQRVIKQ